MDKINVKYFQMLYDFVELMVKVEIGLRQDTLNVQETSLYTLSTVQEAWNPGGCFVLSSHENVHTYIGWLQKAIVRQEVDISIFSSHFLTLLSYSLVNFKLIPKSYTYDLLS